MIEVTVTTADIRALLTSPGQDPVLYINEDGELDTWVAAYVDHRQVVLTRQEVCDYFNGEVDGLTAEDLQDLVPEAQATAEEILAAG